MSTPPGEGSEPLPEPAASSDQPAVPPDQTPEATDDPAPAQRRGRRRRLSKSAEDDLTDWRWLQAHPPGEAIKLTARGDGISRDGGTLAAVGVVMTRFARLYKTLTGSTPWFDRVEFGHSVDIFLLAPPSEVAAASRKLERAAALVERGAAEDSPQVKEALRGAVTPVQIGTVLAADLLRAAPSDAPAQSAQFGSEVAAAYKSLATAIARDNLAVELTDPSGPEPAVVELGAPKAAQVSNALRASTDPIKRRVVAFGTLSIADAIIGGFGLSLEPGGKRPPELKGKRVVRGTFTPVVEDSIRDQSLWGKPVKATIEITRDALISSSTVRPPTFTLVDVEPRS